MKKLYLIRHAHTKDNEAEVYSGLNDTVLSDTGKKQARELCKYLIENIDVDKIYVTGLRRTKETIEEYAKYKSIEPIERSGLNEMNFGKFDGLTIHQIKEKHPIEYEEFINGNVLYTFPDGENIEDTFNRNVEEFRRIFEETANIDNVMITAHMGTVRNIISHLLVDSYQLHWNIKVENATITVFEFLDDFPILCMMGYIPYDEELLRKSKSRKPRKDS